MTMEALFNNVENAISQYKQACQQEEQLIDAMHDARNDINRYSSQASTSEDPSSQRWAMEQMSAANIRYQQCQNSLQQVQNAKAQAIRYLQSTRAELSNVIRSIEEKLPKFDQSIRTFEQMSSNPFGASASAQLPQLRSKRADYQKNLSDARTLATRIDSILGNDQQNARPSWENTMNTEQEIAYIRAVDNESGLPNEAHTIAANSAIPEPSSPSLRRPRTKGTVIESGVEGTFSYVPGNQDAINVMRQYGQDRIEYHNNMVDFSPFTSHNTPWGNIDCSVDVAFMTKNRDASGAQGSYGYDEGNYTRADIELSRKISRQTGLTVTSDDVRRYRSSNGLTWHEVENTRTMQLIPTIINASAPHTGGVSMSDWVRRMGDVSRID